MQNNNTHPKAEAAIHLPSLFLGISIMMLVSVYPIMFADKLGKVNHWSLMVLMWSMAAGLIRGVGFIPKNRFLKIIFSSWAAFLSFIIFLFIMNAPLIFGS